MSKVYWRGEDESSDTPVDEGHPLPVQLRQPATVDPIPTANGFLRKGFDSKAVTASTDYTANDVVSDGSAWQFPNMAPDGAFASIVGASAICTTEGVNWRLRIWLFSQSPATSVVADNSVFSTTEADQFILLGYIDLPAMADIGDLAFAQTNAADVPYTCDDSLFAIVQTLDAETGEAAGMTMAVTLWARG